MVSRVAIIGDASGRLEQLRGALSAVDVDLDSAKLPEGLTVVQVGDLIHKGPASDAIVAAVDRFRRSGAAWVQLCGNYEAHHLAARRFWATQLSATGSATLRCWLDSGWLHLATAVTDTENEQWLISHAGLTYGNWQNIGAPTDASTAAAALDYLWDTDPQRALEAGMLLDRRPNPSAGAGWADPVGELFKGWYGRFMPFGQIHGHALPYHWLKTHRRSPVIPQDAKVASLDKGTRHTRLRIGAHELVGIDPGNSNSAWATLHPLVLHTTPARHH